MEALLQPYADARDEKKPFDTALENGVKGLRHGSRDHPGEELVDGEHNITASLQERRGTPEYDLVTIAEHDRICSTGCSKQVAYGSTTRA